MAKPEDGQFGRGDQPPVTFNDIVGGFFDGDPAFGAGSKDGFNRFGQETAERIAGWQRDGVVRVGGIQLPSSTPRAAWDTSGFFGMYVAIPYPSDAKSAPRFALMLPDRLEGTKVVVVKPRLSNVSDPEIRKLEDDDNRTKFMASFSPSTRPFIHPTWQPEEGLSTKHALLHDRALFGASFDSVTRGRNPEEVLQEAIAYAYLIHGPDAGSSSTVAHTTGIDALRRRPTSHERRPDEDAIVLFEALLRDMPDEPQP